MKLFDNYHWDILLLLPTVLTQEEDLYKEDEEDLNKEDKEYSEKNEPNEATVDEDVDIEEQEIKKSVNKDSQPVETRPKRNKKVPKRYEDYI